MPKIDREITVDLVIRRIQAEGGPDEEYVFISVRRDCDVGDYLLADTTFSGDRVSNELRHVFWFPDKPVRAGDVVVVRTGAGEQTQASRKDGSTLHRFFWGLEVAVWNDAGDAAVLLKVDGWDFTAAVPS